MDGQENPCTHATTLALVDPTDGSRGDAGTWEPHDPMASMLDRSEGRAWVTTSPFHHPFDECRPMRVGD